MYERFYGFREAPFKLTSNPRFLFLTEQHREALSTLVYGLSSAKPITVLVGEAGTGKSTVLRAALESEACRGVKFIVIENPTLTRAEFIETLAARFELGAGSSTSKANLLTCLESVIRRRRSRHEITALVIDEAHALPTEILEEIRFLSNLETDDEKLLPVVLVGQPALADRLNASGMRQLKQRIALRCALTSLDLQDTAAYIASRIRTAGGNPAQSFTQQAVTLIHERSYGLPRTISVICDNALLSGFALDRRPVDAGIVLEICRDFDLGDVDPFSPQSPRLAPQDQSDLSASGSALSADRTNAYSYRPAIEPIETSKFSLRGLTSAEASKGPFR
ncbi:MAG: ExeA family protein [Vicinamibacterales bacterium]